MTRAAAREAEPWLLIQMTLFAASVPLLMRLSPSRLERYLRPRPRHVASPSADTAATILRHFQLARRIGSPLVGTGCLTRGLTLYYFLRRAGLDVTLCFGMGKVAGEFAGHCWLSHHGVPFLEQPDPQPLYAHVFSMPFDPGHATPAAGRYVLPSP